MLAKISLAAGVLALAAAFTPVSAAPAAPQSRIVDADGGKLLQQVQYGRCRHWHHECARRWGWRTPGYFRCLRRHDC